VVFAFANATTQGGIMTGSSAKLLQAGVLVAALATGANPASAGPLYALELAFGDVQLQSSTPLTESIGFHSGFEGTNFFSREAFGSAEPGRLRSSSTAAIQLTPAVTLGLGSVLNGTDSAATFRLDDVIISGSGLGVPASLNMQLDGGLIASTFAQLGSGIGAEASANASVSAFAFINGNLFSGTQAISSLWQVDTQSGGGSTFEDGLLTGFTGDEVLTTPVMQLPVNTPITLALTLSTSVDTNTRSTILGSRRQADASSLFNSTLSFPLSGPVFNLPDGYTVNSVSGLIVDNRWQGLADPQPVPEPASLALLLTGLLFLARPRAGRKGVRVSAS
jgi:hypothetical protein